MGWCLERGVCVARAGSGNGESQGEGESFAEELAARAALRVDALLREIPAARPVPATVTEGEPTSTRIDDAMRVKIEAGVRQLGRGLVERETECRLLMLGALSGEHVLLVGPPGTAKSELGRRLSTICTGVRNRSTLDRVQAEVRHRDQQ